MDSEQTLGDRIRQRMLIVGMSQTELARKTGMSQPTLNSLLNNKTKTTKMLPEIARVLAIGIDELDPRFKFYSPLDLTPNASSVAELTLPPATNRIPIYGHAAGGSDGSFVMNGERLDDITAPPGLERATGAYAVYVVGDSMSPRYESGEIVFVHPGKPCRPRDYVVIQIASEIEGDPPLGFVKRLVSYTANKLIVEQFNPAKRIEFDGSLVVKIHRVVMSGEG